MKKLSRIKLQNAVQLESNEMKQIYGGSGASNVCAYSSTYFGEAKCIHGGADGAEHMATSSGWWCCGCKEAYDACGY